MADVEDDERDRGFEHIQSLSKRTLNGLVAVEPLVAALIRSWLALDAENQMLYEALRHLTIEDRVSFAREILRTLFKADLLQGIQRLMELVEEDYDEDYRANLDIELKVSKDWADQAEEGLEELKKFRQFLLKTADKLAFTAKAVEDTIQKAKESSSV